MPRMEANRSHNRKLPSCPAQKVEIRNPTGSSLLLYFINIFILILMGKYQVEKKTLR